MKLMKYVFLIVVLALVAFFMFGSFSTAYNNQYYSFNYPNNWTKETDTNNSYETTSVLVPNYSNLEHQVNIAINGPENESIDYNLNSSRDLFISTNSKVFPNESYFEDKDLVSDPEFKVLINKTIRVNGMNGFDVATYAASQGYLNSPHEVVEEVMLQKGTKVYTLRLTCSPRAITQDPNIFNTTHKEFESVVTSFKGK